MVKPIAVGAKMTLRMNRVVMSHRLTQGAIFVSVGVKSKTDTGICERRRSLYQDCEKSLWEEFVDHRTEQENFSLIVSMH